MSNVQAHVDDFFDREPEQENLIDPDPDAEPEGPRVKVALTLKITEKNGDTHTRKILNDEIPKQVIHEMVVKGAGHGNVHRFIEEIVGAQDPYSFRVQLEDEEDEEHQAEQ